MPVIDTYASRRQAERRSGKDDVYTYDSLPGQLRKQIVMNLERCLGGENADKDGAWQRLYSAMEEEFSDFPGVYDSGCARSVCSNYLLRGENIENVLSLIELGLRLADILNEKYNEIMLEINYGISVKSSAAVEEINTRFRQHSVGYRFEGREIIRVDNEIIHRDIVKNALHLVSDPMFKDADQEFLKAHRFLREGNLRDCNTAALRSVESTLKAICLSQNWQFERTAVADHLLKVVRENGLFPDYLGKYADSLIATIKSGLPMIRNRQGGHGSSPDDPQVSRTIATFAVHQAASVIVFLVQSFRDMSSVKRDA